MSLDRIWLSNLWYRHAMEYKVYDGVFIWDFSESYMKIWENAYNVPWNVQDKIEYITPYVKKRASAH